MKTIKYDNYSELMDEVLNILESEKENVSIFCDYELTSWIIKLINRDNFKEIEIDLNEDIDEYYVDKCGDILFIQQARYKSGNFKGKLLTNDLEFVCILEDAVNDYDEVIKAYECNQSICFITYDEYDLDDDEDLYGNFDDENCCECCNCKNEIDNEDESLEEESKIIGECLDFVFNTDSCIDCKIERIVDLVYKFKNIGFADAKDYMKSCIEELD